MPEIGSRVFAVRNADDETVNVYGKGTYQGRETPPGFPIPNPKLVMDDGTVVWGYQCWWGPEDKFDQWVGKRTVNTVTLEN